MWNVWKDRNHRIFNNYYTLTYACHIIANDTDWWTGAVHAIREALSIVRPHRRNPRRRLDLQTLVDQDVSTVKEAGSDP